MYLNVKNWQVCVWVLKDELQGSAGVILTSIMYSVNNGQMKITSSVTLWTFQQTWVVYAVPQIQSQPGSEI